MRFGQKVTRKIIQFFKGSNVDMHPKLRQEGQYYDANNMSVRKNMGHDFALEDIKGERAI